MDHPHYLHSDIFEDLVDRLMTARPTAVLPCLRSVVTEILGEVGNVWPADIYAGEQEPECS